jgi:hypothetical protein
MAKKPLAEGEVVKPEVTEMPTFRDAQGHLFKLKASDFPNSQEGRIGFCSYQVERWTQKRDRLVQGVDPVVKKQEKLEALKKKLAELEAELAGNITA